MALITPRLSNKLRLSTLVMLLFVLLGSLLAYLKMRQVSRLSESVAEARIPALTAVRDLRVFELAELSALQSYVLFGADPAMARRYGAEFQDYRAKAQASLEAIANLRPTYDSIVGAEKGDLLLSQYRTLEDTQRTVAELAVGHGGDGTGKAFDLLQGPAATANAAFLNNVSNIVEKLLKTTSQDLNSIVTIKRLEAIHLWLFVFLGGLLGAAL